MRKKITAVVLATATMLGGFALVATPAFAGHKCVSVQEWNRFGIGDRKAYVEALFGDGYNYQYHGVLLASSPTRMFRGYAGCSPVEAVRVKYVLSGNAWVVANARIYY